MKNLKIKRLISFLLALIVGWVGIDYKPSYAAKDLSGHLKNKVITLFQGGKEINENDKIFTNQPLTVNISFGVPSKNDADSPQTYVELGDTVEIPIGESIVVKADPFDIKDQESGKKIATASFITEQSGAVKLNVIFNGDESIYADNENIKIALSTTFGFKIDGIDPNGGNKPIVLFNKQYTLEVPVPEEVIGMDKSGIVDVTDKTIQWTLNITGSKGQNNLDFSGKRIKDNLANVGEYVKNSVEITGGPEPTVNLVGDELQIDFKTVTENPTVKFKTKLTDREFFGTVQKTNTAIIEDIASSKKITEATADVNFKKVWIDKYNINQPDGKGYREANSEYLIDWEIVANEPKAHLKDVVIYDYLQKSGGMSKELSIKEASYKIGDGQFTPIQPVQGIDKYEQKFVIGNITDKVTLKVTTKIENPGNINIRRRLLNIAQLETDTVKGYDRPRDTHVVVLGEGAISKTVEQNEGTFIDPVTEWIIKVPKKIITANTVVYDMMISDNTVTYDDWNNHKFQLTAGQDNSSFIGKNFTVDELRPEDLRHLEYIDGSFTGTEGLNLKIYNVDLSGRTVAKLLEITGYEQAKANAIGDSVDFKVKSRVTDPDFIFNKNRDNKTIVNTAKLVINNELEDFDGYWGNIQAKPVDKRSIKAEKAQEYSDTKNINILEEEIKLDKNETREKSFNAKDRSILYIVSINAGGAHLKSSDFGGKKIVAVDTLPTGWVHNINSIQLFEGIALDTRQWSAESRVLPTKLINPTDLGVDIIQNDNTITLEFDEISKPYVLLYKATPKDDEFKTLSTPKVINNTITLGIKDTTHKATDRHQVKVSGNLIKKEAKKIENGVLKWSIDYTPYTLVENRVVLEDVLGEGIEIRRLGEELDYTNPGNFELYEVDVNPDGTLTEKTKIGNLKDILSYEEASRKLVLRIDDFNKNLRFNYITDLTGQAGQRVNNVVTIKGIAGGYEPTAEQKEPYQITSNDVTASLEKSSFLEITKVNKNTNDPIGDVQFTLELENGQKLIQTTMPNGKAKFTKIPIGRHILKETVTPPNYIQSNKTWNIVVTKLAQGYLVTVDDTPTNNLIVQNEPIPPIPTVQNIVVSKEVLNGTAEDNDKVFNFRISLNNGNPNIPYQIEINGITKSIRVNEKFPLKNGQTATIKDIPKGLTYQVMEDDYSAEYDTSTKGSADRGIIGDDEINITFTNTKKAITPPQPPPVPIPKTGELRVHKVVTGKDADLTKEFDFSLELTQNGNPFTERFSYLKNGVSAGNIIAGETFKLANNEDIVFTLPENVEFKVIETAVPEYKSNSVGNTGVIENGIKKEALFTNEKIEIAPPQPPTPPIPSPEVLSNLQIIKVLEGNNVNYDDIFKFKFTIEKDNAEVTDTFKLKKEISGVESEQTIVSGQEFEVKGAEKFTLIGLKNNTRVSAEEIDALDYVPESPSQVINITTDTALFTMMFKNTKNKVIVPPAPNPNPNPPGGGGSGGGNPPSNTPSMVDIEITTDILSEVKEDEKDVLEFVANLGDDSTKLYKIVIYREKETVEYYIKSGESFKLAKGDKAIITVEEQTPYSVVENTPEKYALKVEGDSTGRTENTTIKVHFINTRKINSSSDNNENNQKQDKDKDKDKPEKPDEKPNEKPEEGNLEYPEQPEQENPKTDVPTSEKSDNPKEKEQPPLKIVNKDKIKSGNSTILYIVDPKGNPLGKAKVDPKNNTFIFVETDEVPQGTAVFYEETNVLEILEEKIPEGNVKSYDNKLPKTGTSSIPSLPLIGGIMLLLGTLIVISKKKDEHDI